MPTDITRTTRVDFRAAAVLDRPNIAAAMMLVVSLCSQMDYRWAVVLAEMLEAEAAIGVAMFNAVDNQQAKGRLLIAAANKRLSADHHKQLKALIRDAIKAAGLRNLIAHGQWGGVPGDVDGIVLGDGRWASTAVAGLLSRTYGAETILGSIPPSMSLSRYTVDDFQNDAGAIADLIERQIELTEAFKKYRATVRGMAMPDTSYD